MTAHLHLHLTRSAALASASAVLAVTTMGSAGALVRTTTPLAHGTVSTTTPSAGSTAQAPIAATSTAASLAVRPAAATAGVATSIRVATAARRAVATAPHATSAAVARTPSARTVSIRNYVVAPGSQHAIDTCHLVLWTTKPLWLAGHNWCGFQWLSGVATGTVVTVTRGPAAGRYLVTGHRVLTRQSGGLPRVAADLVLQTCVGHGTGLTLARRL